MKARNHENDPSRQINRRAGSRRHDRTRITRPRATMGLDWERRGCREYCRRQDLNLHPLVSGPAPQAGASANSATPAEQPFDYRNSIMRIAGG